MLDVGQGLDVVDRRRPAEQAARRRERRLAARVGAQAFEAVELRGLLAADVAAGAAVYVDHAVETAAEDVVAVDQDGDRLARNNFV